MHEDALSSAPISETGDTLSRILLVSVDDLLSEVLTTYLRQQGHPVTLADTPEDAREDLARRCWDIVLIDWRPGPISRHLVELACGSGEARVVVMLPHTHTLRWRAEQITVLNHPFRLREVAAKLCA